MAHNIQDLVGDLAYAAQLISDVHSDFGLHHCHLDNEKEVSIQNQLMGLLMRCIAVRKDMEKL